MQASLQAATDRASKPSGRGKRMSGRQILDIHEGKARMKPRHHQPIPNQYGTWWGLGSEVKGYGLVVGRGENTYFAAPAQALLGGTSCWMTDHPKEARLREKPLGACHEG